MASTCVLPSPLCCTPVPHPSYSLLLYRKEISAALYAADKEGASPVKPPPEAEQKDENFYRQKPERRRALPTQLLAIVGTMAYQDLQC